MLLHDKKIMLITDELSSDASSSADSSARGLANLSLALGGGPSLEVRTLTAKAQKTVVVCDTQPVTAEGLRILLSSCADLRFLDATASLVDAYELLRTEAPDVLLLDKSFGLQIVLEWMPRFRQVSPNTQIAIWGVPVTEAEALRFLQAGARGLVRKTTTLQMITACLRTVSTGGTWMEDCVFRGGFRPERSPRTDLTAREQQVLALVEQGYKNREIAHELGIRPGTVKIHLKHIFEKTGVHGRYGLAINTLAAAIPAVAAIEEPALLMTA